MPGLCALLVGVERLFLGINVNSGGFRFLSFGGFVFALLAVAVESFLFSFAVSF